MSTEVERPVDCRPVYVPQPPQVTPRECPYTFHGKSLALLSRGGLRRFAREKRIQLDDVPIDATREVLFAAVIAHLQRIGWNPEQDLRQLKKGKAT